MSAMEREDWELFLDNNYHPLSRRIRVESLLTRLRSDSVISQDDQEMILNKYCTQFLKAGHLLDIVKTKGKTGFLKFMEAVEYEYPDVYLETTGVEPRPNPDKELRRRPAVTSIVVLDKMGDLIHTFTKQISEKQSELKQFQALVEQLKADLGKQTDEQKMMEDQIQQLKETIEELRDEKKELEQSLLKERRLGEEVKVKYDQLRNKKLDEFYELSRQMISKSVSLDPKINGPASSTTSSPSSLSSPVKDRFPSANKGKPCQQEAETTWKDEKKTGSDVSELKINCCQLQESNNRLQCCIEEFKNETEESRLKQLQAEALSHEAAADNEKLKMEIRKLESQCKLMADLVRQFKKEIDSRPSKSRKDFVIPTMFPQSSRGGDNDESRSSSDTSSPDMGGGPFQPSPMKPPLRSTKGDQKKEGYEADTATNTLLRSSRELFAHPWQSSGK